MIELTTETYLVVTFDGHVLEFFRTNGGSERVHIRAINSIGIEMDKRGRHTLEVRHTPANRLYGSRIAPENLGEAEQFVAAVKEAMA